MRSKAPLILMEQMVMLLVFALAAALCLQAFVKSDALSSRSEARDRALLEAQNAAEAVRHCDGDFEAAAELLGAEIWDGESLTLNYDSDWNLISDQGSGVLYIEEGGLAYMLGVGRMESGEPGLGRASVWVKDMNVDNVEDDLFRLEVAWQEEVSAHG